MEQKNTEKTHKAVENRIARIFPPGCKFSIGGLKRVKAQISEHVSISFRDVYVKSEIHTKVTMLECPERKEMPVSWLEHRQRFYPMHGEFRYCFRKKAGTKPSYNWKTILLGSVLEKEEFKSLLRCLIWGSGILEEKMKEARRDGPRKTINIESTPIGVKGAFFQMWESIEAKRAATEIEKRKNLEVPLDNKGAFSQMWENLQTEIEKQKNLEVSLDDKGVHIWYRIINPVASHSSKEPMATNERCISVLRESMILLTSIKGLGSNELPKEYLNLDRCQKFRHLPGWETVDASEYSRFYIQTKGTNKSLVIYSPAIFKNRRWHAFRMNQKIDSVLWFKLLYEMKIAGNFLGRVNKANQTLKKKKKKGQASQTQDRPLPVVCSAIQKATI